MSKENPSAPDPISDPDPVEKFAKEAHDLGALRKTVEDGAAVSGGFWLSYLFVLFYIGIAAGAPRTPRMRLRPRWKDRRPAHKPPIEPPATAICSRRSSGDPLPSCGCMSRLRRSNYLTGRDQFCARLAQHPHHD
jgi:hypothetical protein